MQYCVAVQGKEVVGITGIHTSRLCPETVVWMGWTAVRPGHRRQGIARRLIDHVALVAKESRLQTSAAYTSEKHPRLLRRTGRLVLNRKKAVVASSYSEGNLCRTAYAWHSKCMAAHVVNLSLVAGAAMEYSPDREFWLRT